MVRCLVEGNSIRATCRLTGAAKATVLKLLVELGEFCSVYQDHVLRNLHCQRVEADEIWAFVGAKARNATRSGDGDIWTFTAIDPDSKLMLTWLVGGRTPENADCFIADVADRVAGRIQLTTDGHGMYLTAVRRAFDIGEVDYAMLVKTYGTATAGEVSQARKYSPMVCTGAKKERMIGRPDMDLVSTSIVERANLSMRTQMRRFTGLTNGFSKKAENHAHAVSLYFMYYNFCRPHTTLTKARPKHYPTTPAMAAGIADRVWTVEDILGLMDPNRAIT
ncbi:MAG: IS1 family transposase [Dokdonella sp.]